MIDSRKQFAIYIHVYIYISLIFRRIYIYQFPLMRAKGPPFMQSSMKITYFPHNLFKNLML
jgi:hypothetical protein